jgi:hypothetical protein
MGQNSASFQIIAAGSVAAGATNEDAWGSASNGAWVIDGATDVGSSRLCPGPSDANWLAHAMNENLCHAWPKAMTNSGAIRRALSGVRTDLRSAGGCLPTTTLGPTAAIAVVRWTRRTTQFSALGDCTVIIEDTTGRVVSYCEPVLQTLDRQLALAIVDLKRSGQSEGKLREEIASLLRAQRLLANRHDGYWILDLRGRGLAHARKITIRSKEIRFAAILSDGLYRLVDTYGVCDDRGLLDWMISSGVPALVDQLRSIERRDPCCERYLRVKASDDATAVVIANSDPRAGAFIKRTGYPP